MCAWAVGTRRCAREVSIWRPKDRVCSVALLLPVKQMSSSFCPSPHMSSLWLSLRKSLYHMVYVAVTRAALWLVKATLSSTDSQRCILLKGYGGSHPWRRQSACLRPAQRRGLTRKRDIQMASRCCWPYHLYLVGKGVTKSSCQWTLMKRLSCAPWTREPTRRCCCPSQPPRMTEVQMRAILTEFSLRRSFRARRRLVELHDVEGLYS